MLLEERLHHCEILRDDIFLLGGQESLRLCQPGQQLLQHGGISSRVPQGFLEPLGALLCAIYRLENTRSTFY